MKQFAEIISTADIKQQLAIRRDCLVRALHQTDQAIAAFNQPVAKRRSITPESRATISASQKRRWAKVRAQKGQK